MSNAKEPVSGPATLPPRDLLDAWIRDASRDLTSLKRGRTAISRGDEFRLLYGPCTQVGYFAKAYRVLMACDLEREASPLARAAMEHAVTVQWAYLTKGGIDRFNVWAIRSEKDHWSDLGTLQKSDEIIKFAQAIKVPEGKSLPPFGGILNEMENAQFFQVGQAVLSQTLHISPETMAAYLNPTDPHRMIRNPQGLFAHEATFVVATACMLVSWVLADITMNDERISELETMSETLRMPVSITGHVPATKLRDLPKRETT